MSESLVGSQISNVSIKERISKGSGKVYVGVDVKTNEKLVVKVVDLEGSDSSVQKGIEAEMKVGLNLSKNSIFLVKIREVVYRSNIVYIITEYCPQGDLTDMISERVDKNKPFSDDEILEITFQLGMGVETLHKGDVVHRDLKTDNVFLMSKDPQSIFLKIGDFGISRKVDPSRRNTTLIMGTIGYTPPDVLDGQEYNKAGDIYSLGIIFIELIDLLHPFMNEKKSIQMTRIVTAQTNKERNGLSSLQHAFREFALRMISLNPALRPAIAEVLAFPALQVFLKNVYTASKEKKLAAASECVRLAKENEILTKEKENLVKEKDAMCKEIDRLKKELSQKSAPSFSSPSVSSSPQSSTPLPIRFLLDESNPTDDVILEGTTHTWIKEGSFWVVLNQEINTGIFYVAVEVSSKRKPKDISCFRFGIVTKALIGNHRIDDINAFEGTCCLTYNRICVRRNTVTRSKFFDCFSEETVQIALEFNADVRTLHFFVNGAQIPHCVTKIPKSVYFAFSGYSELSWIRVKALQTLAAPSVDPSRVCTAYPWS